MENSIKRLLAAIVAVVAIAVGLELGADYFSLPSLKDRTDNSRDEAARDEELFRQIRDVAELEVSEFHFHKYVWVKHNQKLLSYGDNDLLKLESDIILPVDMVFVGKVDVSHASFVREGERYHVLLPYPTLQRIVNDPDYKAMEKLSRQQWFRGPRISDQVLTQLTASATDSVFTDRRSIDRMLQHTLDNAARTLIPLVAKAKGLSPDQITVTFREDQTPDSLRLLDLESRPIQIRRP